MKRYAVLCLTAFSCIAQAGIIFDDGSAALTNGGEDIISVGSPGQPDPGPLYASFSTDASGGLLSDLKINLAGNPAALGSIDVALFADSTSGCPGGASLCPGAEIADLDSILYSSITGEPVLYDIPTGDPLLDPFTRYWIGLTGGGGVIGAAWSLTSFDAGGYGTGVAEEYFASAYGTTPNIENLIDGGNALQMTVTETPAGTPEPSGMFLLAGGCGMLWLFRRRLA